MSRTPSPRPGCRSSDPLAAAARIESSKAFCHEIGAAAGIPMARAGAFAALEPALAFAAGLAAAGEGVVVKADGLAAGKGVTVCDTLAEAQVALESIFAAGEGGAGEGGRRGGSEDRAGAPRVVVEERLRGPEASVIALCDGRDALALPAARDHKRLGDGDTGPNTGGMGAYSPLPDLDDASVADVIARFHRPALAELARRGMPFRGALYAGLMLTPDRGPVLLEFNARFGDPETQAILPRVGVPLAPLLAAAAGGRLRDGATAAGLAGDVLPALPEASVAIVLASRDYPAAASAGDPIEGLEAAAATGALVFHAGTRRSRDGRLGDGRRPRARRGGPRRRPCAGAGGRGGCGRRDHLPGGAAPARHRGRGPWRERRAAPAARRRRSGDVIRRYTRAEMGATWSDETRFAAMLRVEIAVARAQAARGMLPAAALAAIEERARIDVARIAEIERTTDHDVIAFVSQVAESVGPEGRYLHLGLTSSDVVDTGLALQLRAAGDLLLGGVDALLAVLVARARGEAATVMMGRTHSVHAEPTTLGLKLAGWAFELDRDRLRLARAFEDVATGKISGPVGTYSHLAPDLEAEVLADLGLAVDPVSTQIVQRDRHAAVISRDRDHGRLAGALRDGGAQPPAHRDR